ncbi:Pentatricopeptide repeat-containing protein [Cynara cardunculus var. scolymus]|uniref:Pentatricopeptide repeat-containing protein n=1 Tax=Cynara cardunculus var. scolymus TaxID=59895 RepID=A0A103XCP1_CYNCS|nr:Pentatricopeptide repeat-containing protein [Cynara cardunculus var. scolymus]
MSLFISAATITNQLCSPPHHQNDNFSRNLSIPTKSHTHTSAHQSLTVSSWTSSIGRYCRNGRLDHAAAEFTRMRLAGVQPNHITFVTLLSSCADFPLHALSFGVSLHALVCKLGFHADDVKVGTAIIDMYCKCNRVDLACLCFGKMGFKNKVTWNTLVGGLMRNGEINRAVQVFDGMPERDVISYTALIDGFVKKGHYEHALEWFQEMQTSGIEPDYVTIVSALSACANLGAGGLGLWLHRVVLEKNMSGNIRVNNSLIDMYSRCGCIELARQVFHSMAKHNLVSWNSIIVGFALNGNPEDTLKYFHWMQKDGFKPDEVTFTGALTACSHAGLVTECLKLFDTMIKVHRISPRIEHYGCLVDLYSRARMLEEALNVIENMPMLPNEVVLGSVLAACRAAGDIRLAEKLIRFISELNPGGDSNYVLLSNIYAAGGDWQKASGVRKRMKNRGIEKIPGTSSIEINGIVDQFVAGDRPIDLLWSHSLYLKNDSLQVHDSPYFSGLRGEQLILLNGELMTEWNMPSRRDMMRMFLALS